MRITRVVLICVVAGCQTAQQETTPAPGSGAAGATSYTRGTPDTLRSDTSRGARNEPSQSGDVTLTLDLTSYAPGATVTMRLRNQTRDTLGFNQCSSRVVERQEGSNWVAHPEPGRMCTMELRLLMPNETSPATTDLPQDLRGGTYRIVVTFSRQSSANPGTVRAISPNFTVR
jgi:hypothetical protein